MKILKVKIRVLAAWNNQSISTLRGCHENFKLLRKWYKQAGNQLLRDLVWFYFNFLYMYFPSKVGEFQIEQLQEKFNVDNVNTDVFCKVKSWLKMWEVDGEKARKMYRLLFDALTEDRQRQVKLLQLCDKQNPCQVFNLFLHTHVTPMIHITS